ncbi:hypothetical protein A9Q84_04855 [Halobacteriovorax marinus]|uniref:Adhesin domain-containing protein n=1 Tax=Halobacteriovorax marinus TaxID=97084 RepID=A0A1Y5FHD6_9BACT|nr:hypothetical protein A9Q84_04855 [Halobacteriovorax marinus]
MPKSKIMLAGVEMKSPLGKLFAIVLGVLIAAVVVGGVIFFLLPLIGVVLGFILLAVVAVVLTVGALAKFSLKNIKNKEFKIDFGDDKNYQISLGRELQLSATGLTDLEILLEKGVVRVSESPNGEVICRSENGVVGHIREEGELFLKGMTKEEDTLEIQIPKNLSILIKIGKGELDLREVPVALNVQMGFGKIVAYSQVSDLSVQGGSAKVHAHNLVGNANVELGMGEVHLEVTPTGAAQGINIKSAKCDAKIIVPEGIPVNATAVGLKVSVDSDIPLMEDAPLEVSLQAALGKVEIKEKSNLIYLS